MATLKDVCTAFGVPAAIERSRSGHGAHAWFFFADPVAASLARKFGSALLTYAMSQRHQIKFKSYDRFFPNQDTMPKAKGGMRFAFPPGLSPPAATGQSAYPWSPSYIKIYI